MEETIKKNQQTKQPGQEENKKERKFVNPALAYGLIIGEAILVLVIAFIVR